MLAAGLFAVSLTGCAGPRASAKTVKAAGAPMDCSGGYVALTFDDGPDPAITPRLLDELHKAGIRATFFVIGLNVLRNPEIVRREAAEGHSVQAHTWDHPDLGKLPTSAAVEELTRGALTVTAIGLPRPTFYRPPYDSTTVALRDSATASGLTEVGYTVDTIDWKDPGVDQIVASVVAVRAGGIVEMHDHGHSQTIDAIARIAAGLRARHLCSGKLERTSMPNPDAPTWWPFDVRAVAW